MRPAIQQLHRHLETAVHQRQKQTSLMKNTAWALYDGNHFDKLVEQIIGFVDDLKTIWPIEKVHRQLAGVDIEGVNERRTSQLFKTPLQISTTCWPRRRRIRLRVL